MKETKRPELSGVSYGRPWTDQQQSLDKGTREILRHVLCKHVRIEEDNPTHNIMGVGSWTPLWVVECLK